MKQRSPKKLKNSTECHHWPICLFIIFGKRAKILEMLMGGGKNIFTWLLRKFKNHLGCDKAVIQKAERE